MEIQFVSNDSETICLSTLFAQRTKTLHSVYLSFLYQFTVTIQGFIGEHCFCWLPMKA